MKAHNLSDPVFVWLWVVHVPTLMQWAESRRDRGGGIISLAQTRGLIRTCGKEEGQQGRL